VQMAVSRSFVPAADRIWRCLAMRAAPGLRWGLFLARLGAWGLDFTSGKRRPFISDEVGSILPKVKLKRPHGTAGSADSMLADFGKSQAPTPTRHGDLDDLLGKRGRFC
jgi:hypothetical protein